MAVTSDCDGRESSGTGQRVILNMMRPPDLPYSKRVGSGVGRRRCVCPPLRLGT